MSIALSFEDLKAQVASGVVDTVLVCLVDMQGRLMGKRFHARAVSEELSCRLGSRRLASPDDKTQPLSLFQNITRDHPPGGDDVCPVPIVAAECGEFVARTGH